MTHLIELQDELARTSKVLRLRELVPGSTGPADACKQLGISLDECMAADGDVTALTNFVGSAKVSTPENQEAPDPKSLAGEGRTPNCSKGATHE